MNRTDTDTKRRLILDKVAADITGEGAGDAIASKIVRLKENEVSTIFIISSEIVDGDAYFDLVSRYESEGFTVRNIHLESTDVTAIPNVKKIVEEIVHAYNRQSCMVIAYGKSLAPLVVACYYVYTGITPSKAISKMRSIDPLFITGENEVSFVYKFKRFLNLLKGIGDDDIIFKPLEKGALQPSPDAEPPWDDGIEHPFDVGEDLPAEPAVKDAIEKTVMAEDLPGPADDDDVNMAESDITLDGLDDDDQPSSKRRPAAPDEGINSLLENDYDMEEAAPGTAAGKPVLPEPALSETIETIPIDAIAILEDEPVPAVRPPVAESVEKHGPSVQREEGPGPGTANSEKQAGKDQKKSRWETRAIVGDMKERTLGIYSIRFKLVSIISAVIIVAMTAMIFLATYFFKRDNELRAWENNQKFSEVTALKVKSDFQTIIERSRIIPDIIGRLDREELASLWENDEDFLFIGIAAPGGQKNTLQFVKSIYNTALMTRSGIPAEALQNACRSHGSSFVSSFNGDISIHNVSGIFQRPVAGLSLPLYRNAGGGTDRILVSFIRLDRLLKAFRTAGLVNVFMVNDRGDVIAHPDSSIVVSGVNYRSLPIVKIMMKSPLDNGQVRYRDEHGIASLGSFKKIGIGGCGVIATVQESRAYEQVYRIQRWNFYLLVIILTLSILIVFIFGKTMTTPLQRLVAATDRIKQGNYSVDIIPTTRDEIGLLTGSFIEMGRGLEEREKMKDAFGKFVNKEIADRVLRGEIALGGERKNVAIFFSDIRNFTAISEKLEPEEVVEFLNDYMTRMVNCVNATGGVVDKYIGDAIMAVWGAPVSTGNDTENAVNAALAMRRELMFFNNGRGGDKKPVIKIGCGINTGPVLAGQIGSEERMEYTVIGDSVNLASRIETLTKPFGADILISEDSYRLVRDIFTMVPMQKITVKGKTDPQQIYAVLGRIDDPGSPRTIEDLRKLLGTTEQPFRRRHDDFLNEEVKYEIIEN